MKGPRPPLSCSPSTGYQRAQARCGDPAASGYLVSLAPVCLHAKSLELCVILCDPKDRSLPGFSVHEILQARILECVVCHALLQGIFLTQGLNLHLPHWQAGRFFTTSATWEALLSSQHSSINVCGINERKQEKS